MAIRFQVWHYICHDVLRSTITRSPTNEVLPAVFQKSLHATARISAGHNKWSKIKRPKMAADIERSKLTGRICSEILTSVRIGGDNPDSNVRLARALAKARTARIPKATVDNVINKAKASGGELLTLVGHGPGDCLVVIEADTNNKKMTRSEIKKLLIKHGGDLMLEATASGFQFHYKGVLFISEESIEENNALEFAITIGAEEVSKEFVEDFDEYCYKFLCDKQVVVDCDNVNSDILHLIKPMVYGMLANLPLCLYYTAQHDHPLRWIHNIDALEIFSNIFLRDLPQQYPSNNACLLEDLQAVISKVEEENIDILRSSLEYVPAITVSLSSDNLQQAKELVSALKGHADVTRITHNFLCSEGDPNQVI